MTQGRAESRTGEEWNVAIIPRSGKSIVDIKGIKFPDDFEIAFDVDREILIVNGVELAGEKYTGPTPLFPNKEMVGLTFKGRRPNGRTETAGIFSLEDEKIYIDFHNLIVNESKSGEFGIVQPYVPD